ncbi:LacI family transcriptional regulator [Parvularcula flava]|nr:LacI family transcriptional regulator [Aquisalinus luteolus]
MQDIARMAGVSKITVSRVINNSKRVREDTRLRIMKLIEQYGYIPNTQAQSLAFRRSFLIAMIYDNPSPQYIVNMQRGILDVLEETNLQLVIKPCDRSDPKFFEKMAAFMQRNTLFGAILPPSVSEDDKLVTMLNDYDCPCIRIASVNLDTSDRMVRTHDSEGAAEAARHIASLGHKRIAHIHGPLSFRSAHERLEGFRRGLEEHGLDLPSEMIREGAYTYDSGVRCAEQLLSLGTPPTAIFAGNDEMAIGIYQVARSKGYSVPEDLSIVGFDDTPIASRVWPALTTVRLPIREMGSAAALKLVAAPEEAAREISFMPELIVRSSTSRRK